VRSSVYLSKSEMRLFLPPLRIDLGPRLDYYNRKENMPPKISCPVVATALWLGALAGGLHPAPALAGDKIEFSSISSLSTPLAKPERDEKETLKPLNKSSMGLDAGPAAFGYVPPVAVIVSRKHDRYHDALSETKNDKDDKNTDSRSDGLTADEKEGNSVTNRLDSGRTGRGNSFQNWNNDRSGIPTGPIQN